MAAVMEREFQCPSCGAANKVTNPGVLMKICDFCKTAIYWDDESALRSGSKSMDLPKSSRFRVGATGKIKGKTFRVLGRLSYAHSQGTWDEWFVEMQDGGIQWLAEDEGELFLEKSLTLKSPVPPVDELEPGMQISLNDRAVVVEEIGEATCLGGEGEIPFQVEVGETYAYVDGTAADGSFIFGLEYDSESGQPRAFTGQALGVGESKAGRDAREAPDAKAGEIIRCSSCGKPYEGRTVESTEMVVCDSCGAGLQLTEAQTKVVGKNKGRKPQFSLNVGTPVTLEKTTYEVMGRLYYVERDEGTDYPSFEYILHNPDQGYLWLSEENGHFTVSRPIHRRIGRISAVPMTQVKVGDEVFKVYESGNVKLRWVDGALPWTATVGEKTQYVHMIRPPEYIDQERTGKEQELFRGRYVDHKEMSAALPKGTELPSLRGVYSCQPYVPPSALKGLTALGALFFIINLVLLVYSFTAENQSTIMRAKISAQDYAKEHITDPFTVKRDGEILELVGSAPLNNSWISLDFGLVDSDDRVITEFWDEASYYSGRDAEGRWSEGSHVFSENFKIDKAGVYRLLVHAKGGSGYSGPAKNEAVPIELKSGATISWYFIGPLLLSLLVASLAYLHKYAFEGRRWSSVMED